MTYRTWMMRYRTADTAFGDLARDIARDERFPSITSLPDLINYLESRSACDQAIVTGEASWRAYEGQT